MVLTSFLCVDNRHVPKKRCAFSLPRGLHVQARILQLRTAVQLLFPGSISRLVTAGVGFYAEMVGCPSSASPLQNRFLGVSFYAKPPQTGFSFQKIQPKITRFTRRSGSPKPVTGKLSCQNLSFPPCSKRLQVAIFHQALGPHAMSLTGSGEWINSGFGPASFRIQI